jgi:hypothetical protein
VIKFSNTFSPIRQPVIMCSVSSEAAIIRSRLCIRAITYLAHGRIHQPIARPPPPPGLDQRRVDFAGLGKAHSKLQ